MAMKRTFRPIRPSVSGPVIRPAAGMAYSRPSTVVGAPIIGQMVSPAIEYHRYVRRDIRRLGIALETELGVAEDRTEVFPSLPAIFGAMHRAMGYRFARPNVVTCQVLAHVGVPMAALRVFKREPVDRPQKWRRAAEHRIAGGVLEAIKTRIAQGNVPQPSVGLGRHGKVDRGAPTSAAASTQPARPLPWDPLPSKNRRPHEPMLHHRQRPAKSHNYQSGWWQQVLRLFPRETSLCMP